MPEILPNGTFIALRKFLRVKHVIGLAALVIAGAACEQVAEIGELIFDRQTARERYTARLEYAGLIATAVGQDWLAAGERALRDAPVVTSPWREEGYLAPGEPSAIGYRVAVRRGQQVDFGFELDADSSTLVFLDVWQITQDTTAPYQRIVSADSGEHAIHFEPRRDGEFVVRLQPELLRGGRFRATLQVGPMLAFPVQGGRDSDIGSDFGDPRDGGVRDHHGIDIFAARGTPAVAAAPATVSRVEETPRGGRVVWLRDRRGHSLYYAHLDSQVVVAGTRVETGDTLGFVGNTGNARTTPPHLHFGVYSRGPVNPYWFVRRPGGVLPRLSADTSLLGRWARVTIDDAPLRSAADASSARLDALHRNTVVQVVGATGDWYRVRLPDRSTGYLSSRHAGPADLLRVATLAAPAPLRADPDPSTDIVAEYAAGDSISILGEFRDYWLVRDSIRRGGWVARLAAPQH